MTSSSNEVICPLACARSLYKNSKYVLFLMILSILNLTFDVLAQTQCEQPHTIVSIGYQQIYNPWKSKIHDCLETDQCEFEEVTCWDIHWREYDSGAKVIDALASGEVDIAVAGSTPIAAAISRGVKVQLFWIAEDIASAEALVVRESADIHSIKDLAGKKLGVPFFSTSHYHTLVAMEEHELDPNTVQIINLQPRQIVEAWKRGDIDAAYIWYPFLGDLKDSGATPLIDSGELGRRTFDGLVVRSDFASQGTNRAEELAAFVMVIAAADDAYRSNPNAWGPGSEQAKKIASVVGGSDGSVRTALDMYIFPTIKEQMSSAWLACGTHSGAVQALTDTSKFLMRQKKIRALSDDYTHFVTAKYVAKAINEKIECSAEQRGQAEQDPRGR